MPYKQILAAVELSEAADQVLRKARELAEDHGASLASLTVVRPLAQVYGGLDMMPIGGGSVSFEEEARRQSETELARLSGEFGIAAENSHVRIGNPAAEIRHCAEELEADLIVLGTHGRHGLGLLLGSTANGVLHGVTTDVLAVRIAVDDDA